jgi:predicted dehydrogenase
MARKVIHVGVGLFGQRWCRDFLPPNIQDGTIEIVAIADVDPAAVERGRQLLGLPAERCYSDPAKAFAAHASGESRADFCTIVVPPAHHEKIVDLAVKHGVDILSEKPIADTMAASLRIAAKVKQAGRKMAVTMSHRFDQDKTTLRALIRSGVLGKVNTVSLRYAADLRKHMAWGALFRHEMQDPLLIEGAVHHLDIIADLAGAPCETLYASTWRPGWAEYKGDTDGLVMMTFANGVRGVYEGTSSAAAGLNDWSREYVRVDCELGSAVLNSREIEIFARVDLPRQRNREGQGQKIQLLTQPKWFNTWLIERFARWIGGGERLETHVEANLQASALVFGAIESARTGAVVKVQELLKAA